MTYRYWAKAPAPTGCRYESPGRNCKRLFGGILGLPPVCPDHGLRMKPARDQKRRSP